MALVNAAVKIRGTRPLLFNNFTIDSIPLIKKEKKGVAGNNPDEWKNSYKVTEEGQLYLNAEYIFSCLRSGAKHIPNGRGTMEPIVSATLQVITDKLLLNRFVFNEDELTRDDSEEVYIDVRPVSRRGVKNIRYRLATAVSWETCFIINWDNTLISWSQMESICIDAGAFAGLGDGRKIGYGRFDVIDFDVSRESLNA